MAKEDLIPMNKRTEAEQKEIATKGGVASGVARREKATMRKTLEMLLNSKNNKGITYKELATLGLIKGAVNGKAENYRTMIELLGELNSEVKLTPEININVVNNEELEKAMYEKE